MPQTALHQHRPPLVTAVAIVAIVAGAFPFIEIAMIFVSSRFSAFFFPLVHAIVPLGTAALLALLLTVGVIDVVLGIGILLRYHLVVIGMIVRSLWASCLTTSTNGDVYD